MILLKNLKNFTRNKNLAYKIFQTDSVRRFGFVIQWNNIFLFYPGDK